MPHCEYTRSREKSVLSGSEFQPSLQRAHQRRVVGKFNAPAHGVYIVKVGTKTLKLTK